MINFWIIAALLSILACLFFLIPSLRTLSKRSIQNKDSYSASRDQENIKLFKERLGELDNEMHDGRISEVIYSQRKRELELALLNDVTEQPSSSHDVKPISNKFIYSVLVISLLFVVGFSFWMYQLNGSKHLVDEYYSMHFDSQELEKAKELARNGDMNALLNQLYEKLQAAPNNIEGWQLLARSSMSSQRFDMALEAYTQIIRIYQEQEVNPAPIYGLVAQAKYYQSQGQITSDVDEAIKSALALDENELNTLGLLAIDAFSNQRYLEAKNYWQKILSIYPDHPARASIEAGIQRVNAELGIQEESTVTSIDASDGGQAWVSVSVSIDSSIEALIEPSDTVFIIAKNIDKSSGSNVPLAVSRHRVDELPITVRLDDTKSMAPIAKLSMAESVMIIARISKSGSPIAQAGDFEAVSADINPLDNESIELVIQDKLN